MRAFYDKNLARFPHPETFTFQTISVLPPANATPDQLKEGRQRAENALQQAKATKTAEEFGLLAEKISDDDYRVMMGEHKPVPADQARSAGGESAAGHAAGRYQRGHPDRTGLHDRAPAGAHTRRRGKIRQRKAQLEKELQQNKRDQLRAALDKRLRQNATIEVL